MRNDHQPYTPKVLIAISNIAIGGGAEKVATTIANELLARGLPTTLLTFYTSPHEHPFAGERISMHEATPASLLGKIPRALLRIRNVKKTCAEHDIDVVLSFLEESNYYVLLSKILLRNRVRMIVSVRNDPRKYNKVYKFLIKILYPFAETVIAVTKDVESSLRRDFHLTNTKTIYNPVNLTTITQKAKEPLKQDHQQIVTRKPLCISIGRLVHQKGQWHLIRAFARVRNEHPTATLIILGDGEYRLNLEALIKKCDLTDSVFLLGRQDNVYPYLSAADLFVFTSLWEGMPNTLLESLAIGIPIVAADCSGGPREIIAPELEFRRPHYPYTASYGTLTLPLSPEAIWEAPSGIPLSEAEEQLASAVEWHLTQPRSSAIKITSALERFDLTTIVNTWQTQIENQ